MRSQRSSELDFAKAPGFVINVKAYSLLTGHPTRPDSLWPDLRDEIAAEFVGKKNVYPTHLPDDAVDEAWHRFTTALRPLVSQMISVALKPLSSESSISNTTSWRSTCAESIRTLRINSASSSD